MARTYFREIYESSVNQCEKHDFLSFRMYIYIFGRAYGICYEINR